jgi:hypothetical protein
LTGAPNPADLDPFRAILSAINGSDALARVGVGAGLRFDENLSDRENQSHGTRIRALRPRILAAYDALDQQQRLLAARAAVATMRTIDSTLADRAAEALQRLGWELRGNELVVASPDVREMFFPRGSQWDAFVVIRAAFGEATNELLVVDPYCDATVFQILAGRDLTRLRVRILCSQHATHVAAEAARFSQQYPGVTIDVRRTRDFHDRFIVIDATICVHVGASLNHAGRTAFMVSRVEDPANLAALLQSIATAWAEGTTVP